MATFKVRYLVCKKQKNHTLYYWQPKKELQEHGFLPRRLAERTNALEDAIKEAEKLNKELDAWRNGEKEYGIKDGTMTWLINQYQKSIWFKEKAEKTKTGYFNIMRRIDTAMGEYPAAIVDRKVVKAYYNTLCESSISSANAVMRVLKLLFSFAVDEGHLDSNPVKGIRLMNTKARHQVWSEEEVQTLLLKATPSIKIAILLAIYTGQRQTDIRKMQWVQYDGQTISIKQQKTGKYIEIPALEALRKALDPICASSGYIVINEVTGQPYTEDHMIKSFIKLKNDCGYPEKQFRDFRRTAAVRLSEAGCTPHEISAITGHTIDSTASILEVYTPRSSNMAKNAMDKLEKHSKKLEG